MNIIKYEEQENLNTALQNGDPLIAVISFDGRNAYMGHIDECMEHHILLNKVGLFGTDIDKYFRIIFDEEGADWTFICPPDYKNIFDKTRRISRFYDDGFNVITEFLKVFGYSGSINIPGRYRRHIEYLKD